MPWTNGLAAWTEQNTAFISVAFSWRLKEARRLAEYYASRGFSVRAGGPALAIPQNQKVLADVAQLGGVTDALVHHNPDATIASRGCPVGCWFCIVPKIEGKAFTLIPDFTPRPILCDNNLSALPVDYQEHIIRRYQETGTPLMDANSGFEPHYFDQGTYLRWKAALRGPWRFALDEIGELEDVRRMMAILKYEGATRKQVYCLIGNEPIDSCFERAEKIREWGGEPYCQPVLPLNALDRHQFLLRYDWTPKHLTDFARYYNRHIYHSGIPLSGYKSRRYERPLFAIDIPSRTELVPDLDPHVDAAWPAAPYSSAGSQSPQASGVRRHRLAHRHDCADPGGETECRGILSIARGVSRSFRPAQTPRDSRGGSCQDPHARRLALGGQSAQDVRSPTATPLSAGLLARMHADGTTVE